MNKLDKEQRVVPGTEVVSTLKKKLHTDTDVLDFRVLRLDTVGKYQLPPKCISLYSSQPF